MSNTITELNQFEKFCAENSVQNHNEYSQQSLANQEDTLKQAIEQLKISNPLMYSKCQKQGEIMLRNIPTDDSIGKDNMAQKLEIDQLTRNIRNYDFEESDLCEDEIILLKSHYGTDWLQEIKK